MTEKDLSAYMDSTHTHARIKNYFECRRIVSTNLPPVFISRLTAVGTS